MRWAALAVSAAASLVLAALGYVYVSSEQAPEHGSGVGYTRHTVIDEQSPEPVAAEGRDSQPLHDQASSALMSVAPVGDTEGDDENDCRSCISSFADASGRASVTARPFERQPSVISLGSADIDASDVPTRSQGSPISLGDPLMDVESHDASQLASSIRRSIGEDIDYDEDAGPYPGQPRDLGEDIYVDADG